MNIPNFDVSVNLIKNPTSKLVGFGTLIIENLVEVHGFKIFNGAKGLFVANPSTKSNKTDEDGKPIYYDDVRFLGDVPEGKYRTAFQDEVYQAIIQKYESLVNSNDRQNAGSHHESLPAESRKRPDNPMATSPLWD